MKIIFILTALLMFGGSTKTYAAAQKTIEAAARETTEAAFIDLFPLKLFDVGGEAYIEAEILVNYGFEMSESEENILFMFNEHKDFIPLPIDEINILKSDILQAAASYEISDSTKKLYLDGEEIAAYFMEGKHLISLAALGKYGELSYDELQGQYSLVYGRTVPEKAEDGSVSNGRIVFSVETERFVPGNNTLYPYTAVDLYNRAYTDGKMNGYAVEFTENIVQGNSRAEGFYVNGIKQGYWIEAYGDNNYLYGYKICWAGNYEQGKKVLFEEDENSAGLPFTALYCGTDFLIAKKSDGSYYGFGSNGDWRWPFPPDYLYEEQENIGLWLTGLDGTLTDNGYYMDSAPENSSYTLEDGKFKERVSGKILAEDVKKVYPWINEGGWDNGPAWFIKNDGSLWYVELDDLNRVVDPQTGEIISGVGFAAEYLYRPVKVMDYVADLADTGNLDVGAFALKEDGSLWQIICVNDTLHRHMNFQTVYVMDNAAAVSSGNSFVLILSSDGILYGLGDNSYGQLGVEAAAINEPIKIMDSVIVIDAAWRSSYVIKTDGRLFYSGLPGDGGTYYERFKSDEFVEIDKVLRYLKENFSGE